MKPYVVFIFDESKEYDFHVRDGFDEQIRLSALNNMPETPKMPHQFEVPAPLYFVANEGYAKRLMKYLNDRWPTYAWGMAEVSCMVRSIIKEKETQYLSINKKGMMPCDAW